MRRRLRLAWGALLWERLWRGLWPAAVITAFGAALALTDWLPNLPGILHLTVLLAFAGALGFFSWRNLAAFTWPSRFETRARVERSSRIAHRPLTAAEDSLAGATTPLQRLLWQRHQRHARAQLAQLRSGWPAPGVARLDVFAVRALAVLVLAVAMAGAWGDIGHRLGRALAPNLWETDTSVALKIWITPPAYTNRSPIYIEAPSTAAPPKQLEVPAGSKALVVVTGTRHKLTLVSQQPREPAVVQPLQALNQSKDAGNAGLTQRLEVTLRPTDRLEVRQGGRVLAGWPVSWIVDHPPTIAIAAEPHDAGRGRLRIDYTAHDDYGVQAVAAHVTRAEDPSRAIDVPVSLPPFAPKDVAHSSFLDLASDPWAGLKVTVRLTATDQAGQTGASAAVDATLPERTFTHPVARELAHWRKELNADSQRAAVPARDSFATLLEHPEAFNGDPVVYLALADATYRLAYEEPAAAASGLSDLLWQTAVRVEDGNLGAAESRLEAAEHALQDAMQRGASSEDISRAVDELQRALAEYTQALTERMPNKGMDLGTMDAQGNPVSPDDIAQAMERLRQLSQMGAQDAAKQMLANLQNMLQALRNAAAGATTENADVKAAEQLMQRLQGLAANQSQLLNESFEQAREQASRDPRAGAPNDQAAGERAAEKQAKLRKQLEELSQNMAQFMGQAPGAMGQAGRSMKEAEGALDSGAWNQGADAQGAALAKLQESIREGSQQMLQTLAGKGISGFVQVPGGPRSFGGMGPDIERVTDCVKNKCADSTAQHVRDILEEIRRRAADRTRPGAEQDYLRRLMKEF